MIQGQYYPFRVQYANAQGAANFNITATTPDRSTFISNGKTATPNRYLVKYSCNNTLLGLINLAPPYLLPWGLEL